MLRKFSVRLSRFRRDIFYRFKCDSKHNVINNESRSAGIIVIGDEILKGQVHDTNSHFIAKKMYKLGVQMRKITVVWVMLKT
ncbi:hypothetical protein L9F63_000388 [Diploptera punctata]|uniref:MoaB/Mog domain-containing protein n=1 Tax=Diploptera punctata TaxID=6984 RepID=A0AAD8AMQ9_DIPPU|nr:hypothetical protein L9F63_000388 [Diploptera punctata]